MQRDRCFRFHPVLLFCGALVSGLVASCAVQPQGTSLESTASAPSSVGNQAAPQADRAAAPATEVSTTAVPRLQPQLVKTAELSIAVDSVEDGIDGVRQVAQQQQGDVLGLQDATPQRDGDRHTASMKIRVPQERLEAALQALKALGSVQRQSITAEDVSDQLVDYQARLRNLKKTEETLLEIMGRSGEVGDVLTVAQELSNVRNSIEQVTAQLNALQNRVAYSIINLNLEETIAGVSPQRSSPIQLQETWESATRSFARFTVDLLQIGVWLLVYSPYWLILAGVAGFVYSRTRSRQAASPAPDAEPPTSP